MKIPFSKVYEVTSFYARFTTEPKGKYEISVCMGTACYVKGSQSILDEFKSILSIKEKETTPDGLFTITASRCIGACGLAPVIFVNKDVHGKLTRDMVPGILKMYN
jgi:NADH:ubiquinone oxidoreductase subunit E